MKRKEISETIAKVGAVSFKLDGSINLVNPEKNENVEVEMKATMSIIRGVLVWFDSLLEDGAKHEPDAVKNMHDLLTCVGSSLAHDLSKEDE